MTGTDDWVRDLVHPDDGVRWAALDRHRTAVRRARRASVRAHTRIDPAVTGSFDPALWAAHEVEPAGSAFDLRDPERNTPFLEWESAYREEWRSPRLVHRLPVHPQVRHPAPVHPAGVPGRAPRRARAADLLDADDPLTRLRAAFPLHLADHPPRRITRRTWRQWLTDPDLAPLPVR
ncbi:hypothetical protein [Saccharothrix longispora]|uniref:hypothetical protein n=1 Tax=Saccharothrix longispora TaxID=33920 RepID=UPI0028FD478D|nr:hypothetical protein [Saccharothrix longispora]MBY8847256.1 hypothetical protein [Saccharothrix sp. MB29]MDU0288954.1 hypothetical protein [Saccharothrix longispora]